MVQEAVRGDSPAITELYERYWNRAYSLARTVVGHHEDAEDVTQESMIVALDRLEECARPHSFGGWLMAIVKNRSLNLVRSRTVREADALPHDTPDTFPLPDRAAAISELRVKLNRELGALSQAKRMVLLLHDLEGFRHREISDILGMRCGSVRSALSYARRDLRQPMAAYHDGRT